MEDFKTGGYCALCLRASEDCICYGQKLGQAAMQSVTKDVTAPYAVRKGIVSKNNQMEEKIKQLIAELEARNKELKTVAGRSILYKDKTKANHCLQRIGENELTLKSLNNILKGE